ncbi:unnamed protein product [Adineta steineri]|uniref:Uncharacterized protein n=1 Tax=Adineta steineri TaxID=433720 RepID=A0A815REA0_9BILA|nr:unnamed protein product [Adineta steineri]
MGSFKQFVGITGLLLVCFVIFTEQASISSPFLDEQLNLDKRRSEPIARTSIPLFRGSNLGIFVRKRPYGFSSEHSMYRRKEARSVLNNDDSILAELLYNNEHPQRRFDDYSENPGPMFGR